MQWLILTLQLPKDINKIKYIRKLIDFYFLYIFTYLTLLKKDKSSIIATLA